MSYLRLCLCPLLLFVLGCKSWSGLELINTGYKVRIYSIDSESYPSGENAELLPKAQAFPKLNLKQMKAILSSLRFYNYSVFSEEERDVFYESDVNYLAPRILRAIEQIKSKQRLVVIYKNLPPGNLVRTSLRSTMLFWYDKQGFNIFLGEIRRPLLSENLVYQYPDWEKRGAVKINNSQDGIQLIAKYPYKRKQLNKLDQDSWLLLSHSNINSLMPKTEKKTESKEEGDTKESGKETKTAPL